MSESEKMAPHAAMEMVFITRALKVRQYDCMWFASLVRVTVCER